MSANTCNKFWPKVELHSSGMHMKGYFRETRNMIGKGGKGQVQMLHERKQDTILLLVFDVDTFCDRIWLEKLKIAPYDPKAIKVKQF
jgi:hypothetical protein